MRKKRGIFSLITALVAALLATALSACSDKTPVKPTPTFTLDKQHIELTADGTDVGQLTLTVANVDEAIEWKSSDTSVATVAAGSFANKATVRPVGKGQAVISAVAGEYIAVCSVKVNPGVYLEILTPSLELMSGKTAVIDVETDAETLSFSSNNTSVATVDGNGLVSGISGGTARITVSAGGKSDYCYVTVTDPYVRLDKDEVFLTLEDGSKTYQLTAESNGEIEWSSEDTEVATVKDGLITAVSEGTTKIIASYDSAEAECVVRVKSELLNITLSETEHTLESGNTFKLTATVTPEQTGDDAKVTWSVVSGNDLVTVDDEGNVTANDEKKYGDAIVRATSVKDADFHADCKVTVPDPYGDWLVISNRATLEAALKSGNENKNMYLTNDIDLGGATINSTLGIYYGTLEGRGFEIKNFSCGNLFGGIGETGVIKQLAITCTADKLGADVGLFGQEIRGTIENCRLDVTFGLYSNQAALGRNGTTTAKFTNTVLLLRNPSDTPYTYAGCSQGGGTWNYVYYAVYSGSVTGNGPAQRTDEQIRSAALYGNYDEEIWLIEDGEIPELKNANNANRIKVKLDAHDITAYVGDAVTLTATVKPGTLSESDKAVVWSSSDTSVATVDNGVVTMLKVGKATITATSVADSDKFDECEITVESATEITLSSSSALSLEIGETSKIEATVNRGSLSYASDDESVATVTANGTIKGLKAGTAAITVRSTASSGKFVTVNVTVLPEIELTLTGDDDISVEIDGTAVIDVKSNRDGDTLIWTSSDTTVATVDNSGSVSALKAGKTVITCTSSIDSDKYVEVTVTVHPTVEIELVSALTIKTGLETPLNASVNRGGLTYVSSDEDVVTVTADGKVTGLKDGTAQITVKSDTDPTKTAVCNITVQAEVDVTITLNKTTVKLDWGETVTLRATANVPGVTWESTDETVATVEDGVVTAMNKDGEVTITVTSTVDTTVSATCTVTVEYIEPVIELIKPSESSVELEIGDEVTVKYTVSKGDVEITVDGGDDVLEINGNTVTAVKAGTVTVKIVSSERSDIYKQFTVTVYAFPVITITNSEEAEAGLFVGDSLTLGLSSNRTGDEEWVSSDDTVLSVNDGEIKALKAGTATITVTLTTSLGKTATASVTVTVREHASVEFKLKARSIKRGGTYAADITATGGMVVYSSKNPAIATVDGNGNISGVAIGKTVITATVGGVSDSIIIDVYQNNGEVEISTANELKGLKNGNYVIVNDIDFTDVEITDAYVSANFQGSLDGRGYALKNITTNFTAAEQGMFGMINGLGTVKNIRFIDFVLGGTSAFTHGGIIRNIDGSGSVKDCYFEGVITARGPFVGPIGAKFGGGSIENCLFNVKIQGAAGSASSNPRSAIARWFNGDVKTAIPSRSRTCLRQATATVKTKNTPTL